MCFSLHSGPPELPGGPAHRADRRPRDHRSRRVQAALERLGAAVTESLSRKTTDVVAGRDAGQKKLANARQFGLDVLTEEALFQLIRDRERTDEILFVALFYFLTFTFYFYRYSVL